MASLQFRIAFKNWKFREFPTEEEVRGEAAARWRGRLSQWVATSERLLLDESEKVVTKCWPRLARGLFVRACCVLARDGGAAAGEPAGPPGPSSGANSSAGRSFTAELQSSRLTAVADRRIESNIVDD